MKKTISIIAIVAAIATILSFSVSAADAFVFNKTSGSEVKTFETPIGNKAFKVSFDLYMSPNNLDEGQPGYLDNFVWITVAQEKDIRNLDIMQWRIENRHIQGVANNTYASTASASAGIVDYGGQNFSTTEGNKGHFEIILENNIMTLTRTDVNNKANIYFTYTDGYFADDKPLYLIFNYLDQGSFDGFEVSNVIIESTDYVAPEEPTPQTGYIFIPVVALAVAAAAVIINKKH